MYGTIARMKIQPGQVDAFKQAMDELNANRRPKGYLGELVYQMDSDSNELFMAVFFNSKEDYHANAGDPEQDKEYQKIRGFLDADPEWHDGEVIHQFWNR